MPKYILMALWLMTTGSISSLRAGDAEADKIFDMLQPLIGKSYLGTFPNSKMTDEHVFTAVYGKHFIRDVHYVRNEEGTTVYEGETIFAKNAKTGDVVWWYWNSSGGYLTGTVALKDGKLEVHGVNHGPANQTEKVYSTMWDVAEHAYKSTSYFWKDDVWQEQWTMTFNLSKDIRKRH